MREIFLGDLSNLKLIDIIKTLLVERKTGVLVINGKENGELYLEAGTIIHAKTNRLSGEEAFLSLMNWRTGKSTFRPDMLPGEKTISIPAEQLLLKWSYRRQEWGKIKEIIPSPHAVFRLSLQQSPAERNIRPDQWNVLALCNGIRTLSEVVEATGWDEFKVLKIIYQLVQTGLLERVEEQKLVRKKGVGDNFFPTIEHELKRIMGPVAPFIIEDKLTEFGEPRESFPQDKAASFIEFLSEEITHEQKRKEFVKTVAGLVLGQR
jgi:hypothetical protein